MIPHTSLMIVVLLSALLLILPVFSVDPTGTVCSTKLQPGHDSDILIKNLHWKEPKTSPSGQTLQLECPNGFLQSELTGKTENVVCTGDGLYNNTYKFNDLLCRSDFQKDIKVKKVRGDQLTSTVLHCNTNGLGTFEVSRSLPSGGEKLLYRVCLDQNVMRTKFSMRPASSEKPTMKYQDRDDDVWGFDGYGKTSQDRQRLSQGYVKNVQQRRTTTSFSDKYNQGKQYPYYFNRGHLVAYTDFNDHEDQKGTVEYLNAAPQWELFNKHSWSLVEREARSLTENNPEDWEIYTGTYGHIPTRRGPLFLVPVFDSNGKFQRGLLPVPQLFWKLAYNTKDKTKSKAFVGINNPEIRTVSDITAPYRLCETPIRKEGKLVQGDEYKGFIYECPVQEFLGRLNTVEKIVKV